MSEEYDGVWESAMEEAKRKVHSMALACSTEEGFDSERILIKYLAYTQAFIGGVYSVCMSRNDGEIVIDDLLAYREDLIEGVNHGLRAILDGTATTETMEPRSNKDNVIGFPKDS